MVTAACRSVSPRMSASSSTLARAEPWAPVWHLSIILPSAASTLPAPRLKERRMVRNKRKKEEDNKKRQNTVRSSAPSLQQWECFPGRWLHRERETAQFTDGNSAIHHIICSWDSQSSEGRRRGALWKMLQHVASTKQFSYCRLLFIKSAMFLYPPSSSLSCGLKYREGWKTQVTFVHLVCFGGNPLSERFNLYTDKCRQPLLCRLK